jgi:SAM-dependent MidA family methyltransferase
MVDGRATDTDGAGLADFASGPAQEIIRRIEARGAITFAEFMEVALYWPDGGYYTAGGELWGRSGDYLTSLDMSPAFSRTIARQVSEMWSALGSPKSFELWEVGAGRGWLSEEILSTMERLDPELFAVMRMTIVESNPALIGAGEAGEAGSGRITRCRDISELSGIEAGVILSNELIDSFAVHIVVRDGVLKEICVDFDGEAFVEVAGAPSTPALATYFEAIDVELAEGQRAEVNLRGGEWLKEAGALLDRGFVITIDYGLPARELYSPERGPTLMCHRRHTLSTNPYVNIGSQDITTHVDFTGLVKSGASAGLELTGFTTQKNFLLGLGILEELSPATELGIGDAEKVSHNRAIAELIMPGGMGDTFKVLVQHKGIEAPSLKGFSFKDMRSYL